MKIVKVILSREALEVYNNLKSSSLKNNIILLKSIDSKFSLLK